MPPPEPASPEPVPAFRSLPSSALPPSGGAASFRQFGRLEESLRVYYELFRQGKSPAPNKTYRGLLQGMLTGETSPPSLPKVDGSKLPPFDSVKEYLGLSGVVGKTTETGWFLHAIVLKKE